jgi:hypothetical protein
VPARPLADAASGAQAGPFQWTETAIFGVLALALAGYCFWRLGRRLMEAYSRDVEARTSLSFLPAGQTKVAWPHLTLSLW